DSVRHVPGPRAQVTRGAAAGALQRLRILELHQFFDRGSAVVRNPDLESERGAVGDRRVILAPAHLEVVAVESQTADVDRGRDALESEGARRRSVQTEALWIDRTIAEARISDAHQHRACVGRKRK